MKIKTQVQEIVETHGKPAIAGADLQIRDKIWRVIEGTDLEIRASFRGRSAPA